MRVIFDGARTSGRHGASPIHLRRVRAASFMIAYLLLSRTVSKRPDENLVSLPLALRVALKLGRGRIPAINRVA